MHKIHEKEFTIDDFSHEHLLNMANNDAGDALFLNDANNIRVDGDDLLGLTINVLNYYRGRYIKTKDKRYWWQMIQLLPSSYNQTRNVMLNYEVLANIYKSRKNHKLDEWREFCRWIESLPYSELIVSTSSGYKNKVNKSDIRWAEDIFKNHGIKLTEAQIDAINSIGTTNIITSEEMVNGIDPDTATDAAVDYAVQMAKDAAKHYSFEKEE